MLCVAADTSDSLHNMSQPGLGSSKQCSATLLTTNTSVTIAGARLKLSMQVVLLMLTQLYSQSDVTAAALT